MAKMTITMQLKPHEVMAAQEIVDARLAADPDSNWTVADALYDELQPLFTRHIQSKRMAFAAMATDDELDVIDRRVKAQNRRADRNAKQPVAQEPQLGVIMEE